MISIKIIDIVYFSFLTLFLFLDLLHTKCIFFTQQIKQLINDNKYDTINIYYHRNKQFFLKYIEFNDEWQKGDEIIFGDMYDIIKDDFEAKNSNYSDIIYRKPNIKYSFNDSKLRIEGYYVFKNLTDKYYINNPHIDNSFLHNEYIHTYIQICILKKNTVSKSNLVNIYSKFLINDRDKLVTKKINSYMDTNFCSSQFRANNLEEIYMNSFFHKQRDCIWNTIKYEILNSHNNKQIELSSRACYLLHGPPGSGKATFAYRVATCLLRSVTQIDMETDTEILRKIYNTDPVDTTVYLFKDIDSFIKESVNINSTQPNFKSEINHMIKFSERSIINNKKVMFVTISDINLVKQHYPEMISPEHLKPIYFGYVDIDTVQDISKFYFKRTINKKIPKLTKIYTIQVITLAENNSNYENGFKKFKKQLFELSS